ncbi:tyrosine-type recombinase/integrase [Paraburkholderia hospita]|uniref:tyrosine-type recombinase/integrase n=1 Tax=Paraburkholderia hospita TaxID=169430 RepID=UPI000DEFE66F|nr:integrase family protein [Paraburkholderia hospita]AXF04762.1 alpha/beta hydrolase [Paraburkholderia hospita]
MSFDARAAKGLEPGSHLIIDEYPGLRLERTKTRHTWIYRYKSPLDGNMRQVKIGAWPATSLAGASGEWERLRALRDSGTDPALEKKRAKRQCATSTPPKDPTYTMRRLCDDYLTGYVEANRASKGAAEIARMFNRYLGPLGNVKAETITRGQAFELIESHSKRAPVVAGKLRSELGAAWDYALDADRLPDTAPNWWKLILRGKLRSKGKTLLGKHTGTTKRVLTDHETGTLLRWLPNLGATLADACTLYLWTGTRGNEIAAMEKRELRVERDGVLWWTIPKAKTKNARHKNATDLRVPLFGRAEEVVRRRMACAIDGFLFPSAKGVRHMQQKAFQSGVHYYQPYSRKRPNSQRARLPVTHWAPHDLRRTARTMLAAMDCPNEVAEAVLGHVQPGVQGTYNLHKYDAQRRDWLKRLSDHLERLATV